MMTRKDFQGIADVLRVSCPRFSCPLDVPEAYRRAWIDGSMEAWNAAITEMADYLETQNPRFDRLKFLRACSPTGL